MFEILPDFPAPVDSWGRLFRGDLYELLLPELQPKWVWTNPSVIKNDIDDDYLCAVRFMTAPADPAFTSIVMLVRVNETGTPKKVTQLREPPDNRVLIPDAPIAHNGPHDARLFRVNNQLFCTATFFDNTKECVYEEYTVGRIGLISVSADLKWKSTTMLPSLSGEIEKNWMPIEDEMAWLYSPPENIFCKYDSKKRKIGFKKTGKTTEVMEYARGSTHLINVGDDMLLGIVHDVAEPNVYPLSFAHRLRYSHRFVAYHKTTKNLLGFSPYFYFISPGTVEFAAGLTLSHDKKRVIASFGYRDSSAWFATAELNNVLDKMTFLPRAEIDASAAVAENA